MKYLFLAAIFAFSANCFAENYHVPFGFYSGSGTWTDNFGASGTWTMSLNITASDGGGFHEEFTSQFDDGRTYSGASDVVYSAGSNFTYVIQYNGNQTVIGQGVSSPGRYEVNSLALSPDANEYITEFGDFSKPSVLKRSGTLFNKQSGRATLYEIKELKQ